MRRAGLVLKTLLVVSCAGFAFSCGSPERSISATSQQEQWRGTGNLDSPAAAERAGCCNGQGGACGCGGGKVQCCDGTVSRNCACE